MTARKPPEVCLGNEGIKIILFRVNVGHEGDVVAMLRNHLERDKHAENANLIDYKVYKVLGLYDIMIILQVHDFTHDLLTKGSFEHVILGNEILCFTFSTNLHHQQIFSELSKPGVFITLIKLRLEPLLAFGDVLPNAVAQFMEKGENVLVIGGLGWNELISIYPHDFSKAQLHDIFQRLIGKTSSLSIGIKDKREPLVQKTYSFMGVSYEVIDRLEETFPDLFEEGEPCPRLHLSVTADNFNRIYQNITTSFPKEELKYDPPMVMMGVYDISIPFKEGSWGRFLDRVIKFRKDNAGFILDTRIDLGSPMEGNNSPAATEKIGEKFPFLNLPEPHTAAILDKPGTAHVISTIYCFNHFIQNPLLQDSFLDLYLPARKLINEVYSGGKHGNLKLNTKRIVSQLLAEFQWAMRERAMGAYLFTEGDEHSFSPIKGGLQKILLALESIPFSLITRLVSNREIPWQGFVSIGLKHEPVHFMENIHIPFEHVLYPEKYWWCLIHETGHILTLVRNVLHKKYPIIEEAMSHIPNRDKSSLDFYKNMADNCFADIFDFIIGFLGNRDLYFRRCWKFLLDNLEGEESPREFFMRHLVRHFFGWLYEVKFISKNIPNLRLEDVDLRRTEATTFLQSLEKIPGMKDKLDEFGGNREKFARKISVETAPYLFLLDHFHGFLSPVLELQEELKEEYNSKEFNEMLVSLQNDGVIIPHKNIKYPHLIPLKLMHNWVTTGKELSFRARIAVILSLFWYSQHNFLPTIFDAYREAQSFQAQS